MLDLDLLTTLGDDDKYLPTNVGHARSGGLSVCRFVLQEMHIHSCLSCPAKIAWLPQRRHEDTSHAMILFETVGSSDTRLEIICPIRWS